MPEQRGLLLCADCGARQLVRTDSISNEDVDSAAGNVAREQAYECRGCGSIWKYDLVSRGRFSKKYLRS